MGRKDAPVGARLLVWLEIAGTLVIVAGGGCISPGTYPADEKTSGGSGGTGGAHCVVEECLSSPNECEEPACLSSQCGFKAKPDGTACGVDGALSCVDGSCRCTDVSGCTPVECNDVSCADSACLYMANVSLMCGPDGNGSCSAEGQCGLCNDGIQNGAEVGVDCGGDSQCGSCLGKPCGNAIECQNGFCVDGVCCDTACDGECMACTQALTGTNDGECQPVIAGMVDPTSIECDGKGGCGEVAGWCRCEDGKKSGDEADVDCGGVCGPTCTVGMACASNEDCANGNPCVDGVCCNSNCSLTCASCNQSALPGLCNPMPAGPDQGGCEGSMVCNAEFSCLLANGQLCSVDGQCASGVCNNDVNNCAPCDTDNACGAGRQCVDGLCRSKDLANGEWCAANEMCMSGHCIDSVCCDQPCGGKCMACHKNYNGQTSGECSPIVAGYDPQNECPDGPGKAGACSGANPDPATGDSPCGTN